MSILKFVKSKKEDILKLAEKYGAYNIRIFGSVAREEDDEKSDIDFLVDFKKEAGLLQWSGFWTALEDLLKHKVDVATERVLKNRIKERVLKEAKPL